MSPKEPVLVLLAAALAGGALWAIAFAANFRAAPALCVAVGLAVGLSWRLAARVVPPPEPLLTPAPYEPREEGLLPLTSLESRQLMNLLQRIKKTLVSADNGEASASSAPMRKRPHAANGRHNGKAPP